ncbi:hypothetical protein ARTHRO8AJ_440127 [Arthrobacter sp. 8AJ]|nr:hypothetical protein ARTHRO8AJ_440127 [Arthrobacter sp. 8AJ]
MQGCGPGAAAATRRLGCTTRKRAGAMSHSYSRRHLPQPRQPQCEACGTEHQLTIHAITAIGAAGGDLVTVSYTCNDCDLFQEHTALRHRRRGRTEPGPLDGPGGPLRGRLHPLRLPHGGGGVRS